MVGITTRVHDSGGIPFEKSIRGNEWGFTSKETNQFVKAIPS
jgi:hypothetical protein